MALFVIGDTHLSLSVDKPMDIFGGWKNYMQRLEQNWRSVVGEQDTVVIPGDVSWGMSLEQAKADFAFLHALPGKKILMKGNHDYWWTTKSKMDRFLEECGFDTLTILHNNAISAEGVSLCGSRGWMFEQGQEHDKKLIAREAGRVLQGGAVWRPGEDFVFALPAHLYAGQHPRVFCGDAGVRRAPLLLRTHPLQRMPFCLPGRVAGGAAHDGFGRLSRIYAKKDWLNRKLLPATGGISKKNVL